MKLPGQGCPELLLNYREHSVDTGVWNPYSETVWGEGYIDDIDLNYLSVDCNDDCDVFLIMKFCGNADCSEI